MFGKKKEIEAAEAELAAKDRLIARHVESLAGWERSVGALRRKVLYIQPWRIYRTMAYI